MRHMTRQNKIAVLLLFLGIMRRFNRVTWGGVHPSQGWGAFALFRGASGVHLTYPRGAFCSENKGVGCSSCSNHI